LSAGAATRLFDALERSLLPVAAARPSIGYAAAGALGSLRNRLSRRWPAPQEVRRALPHLERGAAAAVAWRIAAQEARNRLLVAAVRRLGLAAIRELVDTPAAVVSLRPPSILATFHVGAMQALGPAFERLCAPTLVLRLGRLYSPTFPVELEATSGDPQQGSAAFLRALDTVRGGGFVAMAVDLPTGAAVRCPFLSGSIDCARGPFALARLTGAPLLPLTARWRRGRIAVEIAEPLHARAGMEPAAAEAELAARTVVWLSDYLTAAPAELGLGLLRAWRPR
jgi:hypothetical protein